jgi:membrane protein
VTVVFKNDKVTDRNGNASRTAWWGTVISVIVLLFSASSAFGELQDSLNQIWEVEPKQHSGFLVMVRDRALSFAMVFILGFFMLVSLLMSAIIAAVSKMLVTQFPVVRVEFANGLISFLVFTALFATIFRLLPDVKIRYRDVWPGAVFSTILFMIGKVLLAWYIGRSSTYSMYGAAGSFAIILLWVYYSAQILYLGAEFTRAYAKRYGPDQDAVPAQA